MLQIYNWIRKKSIFMTTFTTTGTTLGRLTGKSNPLRANSANAKQPPCHDPSPWKTEKSQHNCVSFKTGTMTANEWT